MRRRLVILPMMVIVLGLMPFGALAQDQANDEALSPQALEIANDLNCPICEGQSVRDSNSQLARDMRRTIQDMLNQGRTRDEIENYFVERYGVGILREPPKEGFFMTLWWAPVIGLGVGALVLGTFVTQRRARASGSDTTQSDRTSSSTGSRDDDLSEYEERILQALDDDSGSGDRR